MKDFRDLNVWREAHTITLDMYKITGRFPREAQFGLMSQLRRSTSSIGANIAEGCGRPSDADFARFVSMAFSSACETEYHLLLAKDLNYIEAGEYEKTQGKIVSIKRMLSSLIKKLKADS